MTLRLLVTGTGRCGTGWASRVLTSAGLPCGHERVFNLGPPHVPPDMAADSSWLAVPRLGSPMLAGVPVVHVVREPLACIRSLSLVPYSGDNPYSRFARDHIGGDVRATPHMLAAAHWYIWNAWIEDVTDNALRVRIEDGPAPLLSAAGLDPETVTEDDRQYNHRTYDTWPRVTWADLGALAAPVRGMAERYGYEVGE